MKNSNLYLQLEEPAWFVFRKTVKRFKVETIAALCAIRYNLPLEESLQFVKDIRSGIEQMNQPTTYLADKKQYLASLNTCLYEPYITHFYRFGDHLIQFSFESRLFESYLHPLISHLEIADPQIKASLFELFASEQKIVFRLNGEVKGEWTSEETHLVKGLIFMNLINVMFDKKDDFWLMTVHASAVTNGHKTILIPAEPGSGKTTMAALLQDRGLKLVSDDFVPIDRDSMAYPFPIAMSVKEGAMGLLSPLYPELENKPINQITPEKSVRYISPESNHEFSKTALPVAGFIFIKYDPSIDFEWNKISRIKAIKILLDQAWVSPADGIPNMLFDALSAWNFYQLTYSNNQKAVDTILNLFVIK